jgi:hypothetical protein
MRRSTGGRSRDRADFSMVSDQGKLAGHDGSGRPAGEADYWVAIETAPFTAGTSIWRSSRRCTAEPHRGPIQGVHHERTIKVDNDGEVVGRVNGLPCKRSATTRSAGHRASPRVTGAGPVTISNADPEERPCTARAFIAGLASTASLRTDALRRQPDLRQVYDFRRALSESASSTESVARSVRDHDVRGQGCRRAPSTKAR